MGERGGGALRTKVVGLRTGHHRFAITVTTRFVGIQWLGDDIGVQIGRVELADWS